MNIVRTAGKKGMNLYKAGVCMNTRARQRPYIVLNMQKEENMLNFTEKNYQKDLVK